MQYLSEREKYLLFKSLLDDEILFIDNENKIWRKQQRGKILNTPKRTEHVDIFGYLRVRIAYKNRKKIFVMSHRMIWQLHNGLIPSGNVVHHRDGNKTNNKLNNLECIVRSEHSRMHYHGCEGHEITKETRSKMIRVRMENRKKRALQIYKEKITDGLSVETLAEKYHKHKRTITRAIYDCRQRGWV